MEAILIEIRDRLKSLEAKIDFLGNPLARISAQERGAILAKAIQTGDKKHLKNVLRQINGE